MWMKTQNPPASILDLSPKFSSLPLLSFPRSTLPLLRSFSPSARTQISSPPGACTPITLRSTRSCSCRWRRAPSTPPFLHVTLSSCDLRILPSRRMSVFYRQINLQASPICRANFCGIFVLPFWVRFGANLLRGFHRRICDKISLSSIDLIPSQKPSIWEFGQGFPFSRVPRNWRWILNL